MPAQSPRAGLNVVIWVAAAEPFWNKPVHQRYRRVSLRSAEVQNTLFSQISHCLRIMTVETVTTTATSIPPTVQLIEGAVSHQILYYLNLLDRVPGGPIALRYIKSSYRDDPIRSLFELSLFIFAVHYFLQSKKKENKSELTSFSNTEIVDLVDEWEPAPLVDEITSEERWRLQEVHVKGQNSAHIELVQHPEYGKVANLSSLDFYNFNASPVIKDAARHTISTAGVGACGPPNFYGTQDVHVRLEEDLARFLQTESAILYGQDFVTAGSVIPAFLKRGDLAVVDSGINMAIQKALIVSRCDIEWYNHNDTQHLEEILQELDPILKKQKPLRRRFIITEGLFNYTGELVALPEIVALKNKYKYRLFLDESNSIGTIGKTGRGVPEHFGIERSEISITIGSLAGAFASSGGFCAGVRPMVHHQEINSSAYVFSASLPPYSAKVVTEVIKVMNRDLNSDGGSVVVASLHKKIKFCYDSLSKTFADSKYLEVKSDPVSPIVHLGFTADFRAALDLPETYGTSTFIATGHPPKSLNAFSSEYNLECFILQKIIDALLQQYHVLINRSKLVFEQENLPVGSPRLWFHVNDGVSYEELTAAISALPAIVNNVCARLRGPADLLNLDNELRSR